MALLDTIESRTNGKHLSQSTFINSPLKVKLINAFANPFKNAIATARTCYSSKGIITDEGVSLEKHTALAKSIYEAGHHTTLQHAHFQFAIEGVSRHSIWSFLHSHPFYNSEQVSQRYVEVKSGSFTTPNFENSEAQSLYASEMDRIMRDYHDLIGLLTPAVADAYFDRFPHRRKKSEEYQKEIKKKAQEVARYVLPVSTTAYLYHTISGISLLRYYRLAKMADTPSETFLLVRAMVDELLRYDPNYALILEEPLDPESYPEAEYIRTGNTDHDIAHFIKEFDDDLDGKYSKLVDYKAFAERTLASSVREVLGKTEREIDDEAAIALVLDPSQNTILGETLVLTTQTKFSRAMHNVHYTFRKKLSHTADSQDQRHRMTPGSRPILHMQLRDAVPDYETPMVVTTSPQEVQDRYRESIERSWKSYAILRSLGVRQEFCEYILPNATNIRFTESSDLLALHHKHAMRLCYNAQEEIWRASVDEADQIRSIHPMIGKYLLPPCGLRDLAHVRPICPEGNRYCGVKVWQIDLNEYERVI
ncbi:MAG: FAD-dependent thymidylate synthase [Bacteroidota bacterium]|nr:FAD-dependent thymidylate synthase [Bacteroidota bacterium]MDP4230144.1 FAD-dependent thymidylate synthase [Bacteroidota bacterium]MDP4235497.1 FAD-dependent thymidylate synthase [Bacteroidota bacterium]